MTKRNIIGIIGLGYVGLPLFCLFSQKYECWGLDKDENRIRMLLSGKDNRNCQTERDICNALCRSHLTSNWQELIKCNIFIVAVPTPVDTSHKPELSSLVDACRSLGQVISKDDIIVFESTVYPGVTDEICIPILEEVSGLKVVDDFHVGYSPERINVGDKNHQLENIPKIVAATDDFALHSISLFYKDVIKAKIIHASSIKVAEAAKMYENVQRDTLIALANEYSEYCRMEGIDIKEVTDCAATKWNFANVRPGLVGGHCIGVDAYYLLERSSMKGLDLPLVKTSRSVNENKVNIVSDRIEAYANSKGLTHQKVLILGFSYKPNTADTRNTKIMDLINNLQHNFEVVDCYDPLVDHDYVKTYYGLDLIKTESLNVNQYDVVVLAVNHDCFANISCNGLLNISNLL